MFRTAVLRSAGAVSRTVARPFAAAATTTTRTAAAAATPRIASSPSATALRIAAVPAVRMYSAPSGTSREDVESRIMSILAGFDKVNDPSNIKPTAHFANDLALDSLDTVEVVMAIEEEFSIEIPDKDADAIHSVNQAVEYILNQPDAN